jgi:hypothetical protein
MKRQKEIQTAYDKKRKKKIRFKSKSEMATARPGENEWEFTANDGTPHHQ